MNVSTTVLSACARATPPLCCRSHQPPGGITWTAPDRVVCLRFQRSPCSSCCGGCLPRPPTRLHRRIGCASRMPSATCPSPTTSTTHPAARATTSPNSTRCPTRPARPRTSHGPWSFRRTGPVRCRAPGSSGSVASSRTPQSLFNQAFVELQFYPDTVRLELHALRRVPPGVRTRRVHGVLTGVADQLQEHRERSVQRDAPPRGDVGPAGHACWRHRQRALLHDRCRGWIPRDRPRPHDGSAGHDHLG